MPEETINRFKSNDNEDFIYLENVLNNNKPTIGIATKRSLQRISDEDLTILDLLEETSSAIKYFKDETDLLKITKSKNFVDDNSIKPYDGIVNIMDCENLEINSIPLNPINVGDSKNPTKCAADRSVDHVNKDNFPNIIKDANNFTVNGEKKENKNSCNDDSSVQQHQEKSKNNSTAVTNLNKIIDGNDNGSDVDKKIVDEEYLNDVNVSDDELKAIYRIINHTDDDNGAVDDEKHIRFGQNYASCKGEDNKMCAHRTNYSHCGIDCDYNSYSINNENINNNKDNDILKMELVQCASHPYDGNHDDDDGDDDDDDDGNIISPYTVFDIMQSGKPTKLTTTKTATTISSSYISNICSACAGQVTHTSLCSQRINSSIHHEQNISQDIVIGVGETQSQGNYSSDSNSPSSKCEVDQHQRIKNQQLKFICSKHQQTNKFKKCPPSTSVEKPELLIKSNNSTICTHNLGEDNNILKTNSNCDKHQINDCEGKGYESEKLLGCDGCNIVEENDNNSTTLTDGNECKCFLNGYNIINENYDQFVIVHNKVELNDLEKNVSIKENCALCDKNNIKKDISENLQQVNICENENFEASNRLRRLENRFKDLSLPKKLIHESDTQTSTDAPTTNFLTQKNLTHCKKPEEKENSSESIRPTSAIDPTSTIISNYDHSCCKFSTNKNPIKRTQCIKIKQVNVNFSDAIDTSSSDKIINENHHQRQIVVDDDKTVCEGAINESGISILQEDLIFSNSSSSSNNILKKQDDDIVHIRRNNKNILDKEQEKNKKTFCGKKYLRQEKKDDANEKYVGGIVGGIIKFTPVTITQNDKEHLETFLEEAEESSIDDDIDTIVNLNKILSSNLYTNCEFDVRHLQEYSPQLGRVFECYDELESDINDCDDSYINDDADDGDYLKQYNSKLIEITTCDCSLEVVPIFNQKLSAMREAGPLKGLLKKPNRPPPVKKNRVIFDEARNEFFDADYIILIREDCPYEEEDEEPCTCGEHELVRLCCEEGCQCTNYTDDTRTPASPKFAPPIEFVDPAALSPPEGYKDGGSLAALGGALGGHVFGAQHMQQLQVIQRLQAQRAAMLAARASNGQVGQPTQTTAATLQAKNPVQSSPTDPSNEEAVCTECAECAACAAKQIQDEADFVSPSSEEPLELPHVALVPIQTSSPERFITSQKEIIAGEERPKFLLIKQLQEAQERRNNRDATEKPALPIKQGKEQAAAVAAAALSATSTAPTVPKNLKSTEISLEKDNENSSVADRTAYLNSVNEVNSTGLSSGLSTAAQISGILKGGKLWKSELTQYEESNNTTSDDESSKRSVRFTDNPKDDSDDTIKNRDICDGQAQNEQNEDDVQNLEIVQMKKHSSIFHNALRPNSAVRQLFPTAGKPPLPTSTGDSSTLTHEALRAFEEAKRTHLNTTIVHNDTETDTIRRTIERNALRRSLIKYEPKKKQQRTDTSLEERIRRLTCDVDDPVNNSETESVQNAYNITTLERRDSPAGEENPQQPKYNTDKNFSPSSSASSSSSGSTSAYRKITDIFNRDRKQERIPEADENPVVIIPQQLQECRCPAAPDLGIGIQMPAVHTQIHQTPPRQHETRRQFLSTLAPLTSCVVGQRDDLSYYTLAPGERTSTASSQCSEYSLGDIEAVLHQNNDEIKKVAPDVIAGTPGQEQDELAAFALQESVRTDRLKKRYSAEASASAPNSNAGSDDDEQNDYGFNKRPSVRGIKPRFSSTNEILNQMQAQLSTPTHPQAQVQIQIHSNTLPKLHNHTLQVATKSQPIQLQPQQMAQPLTNPQNQAQQHVAAWNYYHEQQQQQQQQQRNTSMIQANSNSNYYQHIPVHARHSFHGHEEETVYQNCQSVAMEQHYGHTYARSPTRRPESPPPLRNYHQTMVLIPYNSESYAHFSTNEQVPAGGQQYRQHNVLEYQQVTQQTIRVPMGYPLPGMQLHVVAGRDSSAAEQYAQYARHQQHQQVTARGGYPSYATTEKSSVKFTERGVPEGAASVTQNDANNLMSAAAINSSHDGQPQQNSLNNNITNNSQTVTAISTPGAVYYAMNV